MERPTASDVMRAMVAMFASGEPSLAATVVADDYFDHLFGIDDRAVARIRWRGRRHEGDDVDRETIDIVRVVDGRAVEHWGAHA
jgi:predicted SnoaL-like aldol condensation-catalyzing enzyme